MRHTSTVSSVAMVVVSFANAYAQTEPASILPPLAVSPFDSDQAKRHQQAWADESKLPVTYTNRIGTTLALIPPGQFQMGSGESPDDVARKFGLGEADKKFLQDEYPQHRVQITQPFYMSTTEVTQRQWEAVMGTRPWEERDYATKGDDYPACYVSWKDAIEFCQKLSEREGKPYRLPTEAEWEYACRAGATSVYHFGDEVDQLDAYAWFEDNRGSGKERYARAVGLKKSNAFGLHDMHGNVFEWCQDWYGKDFYAQSPIDNPEGPLEGSERVCRGGSWFFAAKGCRSADRSKFNPTIRRSILGFRIVQTVPESEER